MTNNAEHLFMCLFAYLYIFFDKVFISFPIFLLAIHPLTD